MIRHLAASAYYLCALALLAASSLLAQSVAPLPVPTKEEVLLLNPFEVSAEMDNSYGALNSNSITRFNTELKLVPVSADIFTADFMRDVGATTVEGMLSEYGAGMGVSSSNPEGDAALNQPGDRSGNSQLGVRGLTAGAMKRDGFTSVGSVANPGSTGVGMTSTFNIERADVLRGPQGLLYGGGGAGGTVNIVSKRAQFNRSFGSVLFRLDQFGSKQLQFDYNYGARNVAVRVALLDETQKYRRVFVGGDTRGYYTQLAWRQPRLRTTFRFVAERTTSDRVLPTAVNDIKFTNAATDPRHDFALSYLLANNLAGATHPVTGAPFPRGAIANGGLNWDNLNSWAGAMVREYVSNNLFTGEAETVWSKWLSSQVAVRYNDYKSQGLGPNAIGLSPPRLNGNPLDEWANGTVLGAGHSEQPWRRTAVRGSVLLTNELFRGRGKSQTSLGYDVEWTDSGAATQFDYFLADASFNVVYNPALPSNLGRTTLPQRWWPVGSQPVEMPYPSLGWDQPRITVNGVNYVRSERNPRDPSWVSANNPLGLASLAGLPGVTGSNRRGHALETRIAGLYLANYSTWFDGRIGTLLGYRRSETFKHLPNETIGYPIPWTDTTVANDSYNLGATYKLREGINAFYSYSSTYNAPLVLANDPLGNAAKPSSGTGSEVGLKFNTADNRLSGSVQYYWTDSKDEQVNGGAALLALINPPGLNEAHQGPAGRGGQWITVDRTSRGLEAILTASPTPNWRIRMAATSSDGRNLSDRSYPLLYNDQFHVRNGTVTYQNGTPFMVPTDAATIAARIAALNRTTDPATLQAQGTWAPLTLAMINDRTGPYYAQPANNNGRVTGINLRNVLRFFSGPNGTALTGVTGLPLAEMQYQWDDPNGTKGQTVVARASDYTVGYAQHRLSLTNFYTFTGDNWLKGFGLGGTVSAALKNRTYYYNTQGGGRELYQAPETLQTNLVLSYKRKLGSRYTWSTQVNVTNLFNSYSLGTLPNDGSGYAVPASLAVTWYGQPRVYAWTNSISF